eukprot:Phypoly_transcript_10303.p2 GENE.Phypoly_transcript_10303~~Phypoly_transcript_10303.p2  ORF type:complete len:124 (+),score=31.54 Phypoly_transcript_10303:932-1303(+)
MKSVVFAEEAEAALRSLIPELRFYSNFDDIRKAIEEVLLLDIRSVRRRKVDKRREKQRKERGEGQVDEEEIDEDDDTNVIEKHRFAIDVLNVGFTVVEGVANVFKIEMDEKIPENWTKKLNKK